MNVSDPYAYFARTGESLAKAAHIHATAGPRPRYQEYDGSFGGTPCVPIFCAFAVCLLRRADVGIMIVTRGNKTSSTTSGRIIEQKTLRRAPLSSDQMEEAMFKLLTAITGTLAALLIVLLLAGRAEAGASASAPSKNSHASQLAAQHGQSGRKTAKNDFGITEYSSSSRKHPH